MLNSTDLEESIMFVRQLASMTLAMTVALSSSPYEAKAYSDAAKLLANLIGDHADRLEGLINTAWEKEKAGANVIPTTENR
jgi:hypothetical protein